LFVSLVYSADMARLPKSWWRNGSTCE